MLCNVLHIPRFRHQKAKYPNGNFLQFNLIASYPLFQHFRLFNSLQKINILKYVVISSKPVFFSVRSTWSGNCAATTALQFD